MDSIEKQNDAIGEPPFSWDDLVESNISENHKGSGKFFESNKLPNKIIRVESVSDLVDKHSGKIEIQDLVRQAKRLFRELNTEYHINATVDFYLGLGKDGNQVVYSVVNKIEGESLDRLEPSNENLKKIENLYTNIARYFLSKYKEGDGSLYIWDINGQSQYIYGRKAEADVEDLFLIDTDIWLNNNGAEMFLVVEWLTRHMNWVERKFEKKFWQAREFIGEFIQQLLPNDTDARVVGEIDGHINAIKKFLNNEELGPSPETAIPKFK